MPCKRRRSTTPTYWDTLSKIWLTSDALEELDRRNRKLPRPSYPAPRPDSSWTPAPDPLRTCTPESRSRIKRLSRRGGADLSDLRNFPDPYTPVYQSMSADAPAPEGQSDSTSRSRSRKRRAGTILESGEGNSKTTRTISTTAYNRNFEQKLIDYGIYPDGYEYPDGRVPGIPLNWDEINSRLAHPRRSLSPSRLSESDFRHFKRIDKGVTNEKPITRAILPIIDGTISDPKCVGGDHLLSNLAPLTDGTLANAKPDHYFGARPEQLDHQIRDELENLIVPCTQTSLPLVPNFFIETKSTDGSLAVATRQACYHGALGARGMHGLQSYNRDEPIHDGNAYTITSTYHGGTLKLYTTHLTTPRQKDGRPEYIMTQLNSWSMTGNLETFRMGATAYRNARDWAKERRDEFITAANERRQLSSGGGETSEPTVVQDDADTLDTSEEAESCDAQGDM